MARGLELVGVGADEHGSPVLTMVCDCATVTELVVPGAQSAGTSEFAYTCDGCESSHWLKVQTGETP